MRKTRETKSGFQTRPVCLQDCEPSFYPSVEPEVCSKCGSVTRGQVGRFIFTEERRLFKRKEISVRWEPKP